MKRGIISVLMVLVVSIFVAGCKDKAYVGPSDAELKKGELADSEGDYEKAFEWYYIAAQNGNLEAQFNIATMYEYGEGVEQNEEEALEWYKKSAESGFDKSQYNLALAYDFGNLGMDVDKKEAMRWYVLAADQNFAKAQYNLAVMYHDGEIDDDGTVIVAPDYKKAVDLYTKAANQDDDMSAFNLAIMYEDGDGVKRDIKTAIKWYKRSAKLGYEDAAYNIGVLYENGDVEGTSDLVTACAWYNISGSYEEMDYCNDELTSIQKRKMEKTIQSIEKELGI